MFRLEPGGGPKIVLGSWKFGYIIKVKIINSGFGPLSIRTGLAIDVIGDLLTECVIKNVLENFVMDQENILDLRG